MDVDKSRRRGAVLEQAILDAAWAELAAVGYADLTMAGVAARAGAAKSVLYRRWPDKAELVRSVLAQRSPQLGEPKLTGDLRQDVLCVLDGVIAGYRELKILDGLDPALSTRLRQERVKEATGQLADALAAAGIDPATVNPRVLRLPIDLVTHDLVTGTGTTDPREITDDLFLPLLKLSRAAE